MAAQYLVVTGDKGRVLNIDASWEPIDIILPAPVVDFVVTIKDINGVSATNNITIYGNSTDQIDGAASDIISIAYDAVTYISDGTNWFRMANFTGNSPTPAAGRGVFEGGNGGANTRTVDYVTIPTAANAIAFGSLTGSGSREAPSAFASAAKGFSAGGGTTSIIDYLIFANISNSSSFGSLTIAKGYAAGLSSGTRGLTAGGDTGSTIASIDYVELATNSNALNFGNLATARNRVAGLASQTRGVVGGGQNPTALSSMEYLTIATLGNGASFGSLLATDQDKQGSACSNAVRGLFAGGLPGGSQTNVIQYITIATLGNAISFGTLTVARNALSECASPLRGVFAGGHNGSSAATTIDFVAIATLSNASAFGSLTAARYYGGGCSNAHGGL